MSGKPERGSAGVRAVEVGSSHVGQRIDNFLKSMLKGVPKERIYRGLRGGEFRVNKRRIRHDYRLQLGDRVRIPPLRTEPRRDDRPLSPGLAERLRNAVLFEDGGLVVIDKPAGVAVHGGSGESHGVIEAMRSLYPATKYLELVHRLDKETSGCLLLARKRRILTGLHEALRLGRVSKRYLVLVAGRFERRRLRIEGGLQRGVLPSGERIVRADPRGKHAVTALRRLASRDRASLLEASTLTGRTHQIRVHAAARGFPVAGDDKYGSRPFNRALKGLGLGRMFLHASQISFLHPETGERLSFAAPLPLELLAVLRELDIELEGTAADGARDTGRLLESSS